MATWYRDQQGGRVDVDTQVLIATLDLLGVSTRSSQHVQAELSAVTERSPSLPSTVAVRPGQRLALPGGGVLHDEQGAEQNVDGALPTDLAPGWYTLSSGNRDLTVVVAPPRLPEPAACWGWMLQLYALRSARSWGMGDFADLRDFASWTAEAHSAGAVVINPVHAITPTHPIQPSPYTPSSRRGLNPLYLRIEDLEAYRSAHPDTRAAVEALRVPADTDRVDHDRVWSAKRAALELLWDAAGRPAGTASDVATFSALAEQHGPRWRDWPAHQRDPATARAEPQRVAFHGWVQQRCADQLDSARSAARHAEMPIGLVGDLAVGVDPDGADAWALGDVLARDVSIGAPPDALSSHGQDWGLAPWRPDRLDATGYAAYRDVLRAVLTHADGVRIDHVMGLWRLWWIPPGFGPDRGTYVRYDPEVMQAILALETSRAGGIVIGEDLGTVPPEVTEALRDQRMLGSEVLWFARDGDAPGQPLLAPSRWPEYAAASISTHDLPTAPGFLRDEPVRVRAQLELLTDEAQHRAQAAAERAELLRLLRAQGLLGTDASEDDILVAMHALLARTPSRLLLISPYDVVGEARQPNLPGTVDEYPNWRLPLPVSLEQLYDHPRVERIVEAIRRR